jgi:hypothetical protein
MIIDGHAHAAGRYCTAESIKEITKRYGIEKILLCPSPKNNLDLKEHPIFRSQNLRIAFIFSTG